uniref:G_PROTEIN_RECEP_F1_2 domain-containing protein n=1 Tax=Steinernema glaseri TaxID=37863 RepID=A0A1I7ZVC9_9BILA
MPHHEPYDPSHSFLMECRHAISFSQNPLIIGYLTVKTLFSTVGLGLCVVLFLRETDLRKTLHFNARLIIVVHFLSVMVNSLAQATTGAYDLLRFTVLTSTGKCSVPLLSHKYAVFVNVPVILSQNMDSLTLVALGIERTVATVLAKNYEKKKHRLISLSLLMISSLVSIWWIVRFFQKGHSKHAEHNLYSMITVPSEVSGDNRLNSLFLALLEIVILVIFVVLLAFNLKLKRAARRVSAPLAMKYQVEENLASVTVLLSMAFVQVLIYTVTFGLNFLLGHHHDLDHENESSLLFTNVSVIYHVALPIIWLIQARQKRSKVRESPGAESHRLARSR